ncbi:lon protease homolog 2, peroxisomal-like [Macrobrachium nipponense]|uniref:lon protease homolog 2, peroxisomal-like n=1 Tax=Macrobrachium nipponense TaxID=159736 RepID=UPI0030C7ECB2
MIQHSVTLPKKLPLVIVSDGVLLPGSTIRIPVSTVKNINLVRSRLTTGNRLRNTIIGIVTKEIRKESQLGSLHEIGTAALVVQVTGTNWPRPSYTLLVMEYVDLNCYPSSKNIPLPCGLGQLCRLIITKV